METFDGDPYDFCPDLSTFEQKLKIYLRYGLVGYRMRHNCVFNEDPPVDLLMRLYRSAQEARWKERLFRWVVDKLAEIAVALIAFFAILAPFCLGYYGIGPLLVMVWDFVSGLG